ncbi:tRNA(fMet)-specific endonuclease VapC [Methanobrevibacter cuticularis]|uniref:tRNA(FMet)-specific endonuclease VapC n=1 Tax=Methanobrevibacter cuticularis TaxID=47311 RepID=A0A166FC77_9EURY|nr:type II toxin-antitoxin system VapC family toxin [Methanobrevibacter cuticularis]KZX17524.1 tRNA(fMet)-specific endonuclease VapC [Methanobrevibacter cuticularis]
MIFLETSLLVNLFVPTAQNHEKALKIMENIEDSQAIISEMVIYETLTVLRKLKQNDEMINTVYRKLKEMIVYEDITYYEKALEDTLINSIGFFDNLSHIVMQNNNIKQIASFDKDFDIFEDIVRIH